jgi:hypothetical protein
VSLGGVVSPITGEAWKFSFDASRNTGLKVDVMSIVLLFVVSCAEALKEIFIAVIAIKKYFQCLIIMCFLKTTPGALRHPLHGRGIL